jgi:hypothetical protein
VSLPKPSSETIGFPGPEYEVTEQVVQSGRHSLP